MIQLWLRRIVSLPFLLITLAVWIIGDLLRFCSYLLIGTIEWIEDGDWPGFSWRKATQMSRIAFLWWPKY